VLIVETPVSGCSVDSRQICPVLDVASEIVHIDCYRTQGMAEAHEEAVAAILSGIEDCNARGLIAGALGRREQRRECKKII
jgi:hypothetical protein